MVDHILVSTPEERKAFFDDATGVRHLQLKRHEAMLKLTRTYENLAEVEMLLQEITPRMRSLKRQVSRLEQREEVEKALRQMEREYYGTLWWQLQDQLSDVKGRFSKIDEEVKRERKGLSELETRVTTLEKEERGKEKKSADLVALQRQYQELQNKRTKLRDEQFEIQKQLELSKVRTESNWSPLPLTKIIEEVKGLEEGLKGLKGLKGLEVIYKALDGILDRASKLVARLERPSAEDAKPDPKLETRLKELQAEQAVLEDQLAIVQKQMEVQVTTQKETHGELLQLERDLRSGQQKLHLLENQRNGVSIELARLEERQNNLSREMDEQLYGRGQGVKIGRELAFEIRTKRVAKFSNTESLYPEIQKLRYKLELIGGIDPETIKEFEDTKTRFDFLDTQVTDLKEAIEDTEKIIDNLDEEIRTQSEKSFRDINKEFQRFFKILFGGGSCSLVKLTKDDVEEVEEIEVVEEERRHHEEDTPIEAIRKRVKEREDRVVGIDIQATPPGKKLKALNLLSGGERALASIALISAIMAVNPSPFVVLDEVDAALDEANTIRFAAILEELAKLTQFIIITHNRATMEKADLLYGVTMGDDGISNLLSVKLEDIQETATARR
jgi:chromosome segregation protein